MTTKPKHTLTERLQMVMAHLGLSRAEFGRECGVKRQNVNNWMNGAEPSIHNLHQLHARHGINPFWVLFEEGDMLSPLWKIPPENRALYDFCASLSPAEATASLEALKLLRPPTASH